MCGLLGVLSKKGTSASDKALHLYKNQSHRGKMGFGYLAFRDGRLVSLGRSKDEAGIKKLLTKERSELILFHHRLPTSTKNTIGTTHPIFVSNDELEYDYYLAHNGVISNSQKLKTEHEALGYVYTTEFTEHTVARYKSGKEEHLEVDKTVFNDSESLAIEVARFIENLSPEVKTQGSAAFWCVSLVKGTNQLHRLYLGKNKGRELKMIDNKKWFGFSSETGTNLEDMKLFTIDPSTGKADERELVIDKAEITTPKVYGFHNKQGLPPRAERVHDVQDRHVETIHMYETLENKFYTYREALDTGVPFQEFFSAVTGGATYYVPTKFMGQSVENRKFYSEPDKERVLKLPMPKEETVEVDIEQPDPKIIERLDELALKYAEKELEIEKYEERYGKGFMSDHAYQRVVEVLESEVSLLEEQMSALGLDMQIVEDTIDASRELAYYQVQSNS